MDSRQKELLKEIMAVGFTAMDFHLYLDTHPEDARALSDYAATTEELRRLVRQYEDRYGPLTLMSPYAAQERWRWIEEPWPWEMTF